MTLPLDPSAEVGATEMSWGPGMFPHPDSNYQSGRLPFPEEVPIDDGYRQAVADRRSDTVDPEGVTGSDLLYELGNPDRFGGQPPLVRTKASLPPTSFPTVEPKTGVTREG